MCFLLTKSIDLLWTNFNFSIRCTNKKDIAPTGRHDKTPLPSGEGVRFSVAQGHYRGRPKWVLWKPMFLLVASGNHSSKLLSFWENRVFVYVFQATDKWTNEHTKRRTEVYRRRVYNASICLHFARRALKIHNSRKSKLYGYQMCLIIQLLLLLL